jgi:phosphoribosylanthranilate isomerase
MTDVKICGLTRPADVLLAVSLGATHVGFNCSVRSSRRVDPGRAAGLVREAGRARRVGVFVDESPDEVRRSIDALGLELLQFHRPLRSADFGYGLPVVAVCHVPSTTDPRPPAELLSRCQAVLFDTADPGKPGGTGRPFDWSCLVDLPVSRPRWLGGGLRPENVAEAILRTRIDLVDVASGVESSPGVKDPGKLEAFFRAVGEADGARCRP